MEMAAEGLDPVRVENPAMPGTPDVNYVDGWIEMKAARGWPVKGGPLQLSHPPTAEQIAWLFRREAFGGKAWLVLSVGAGTSREWFLFTARSVRVLWARNQRPCEEQLRAEALVQSREVEDIVRQLKNG